SRLNVGSISQITSSARITKISNASKASLRPLLLAARDSRIKTENANCRSATSSATAPQPPCLRATYQVVSSGRLPDQIIRYCEKVKYVQSITSVSNKLPQS